MGDRKTLPLPLAWLPVHFRGLYATAVKERPSGWRAEPNCLYGYVGVSLLACTRSRPNRSSRHVPAFALGELALRGLCGGDELARPACTR